MKRRLATTADHDLIDSGAFEGLVEAARRFDACRGLPFPAYAAPLIRGRMLDAIRRGDRVGRTARRLERIRRRESVRLAHELGRRPTDEDLADALGWDAQTLAASRPPQHVGLDQPLCDEHQHAESRRPLRLIDSLAAPAGAPAAETLRDPGRVFRGLSPRQREVLLRHAGGETLEEIGSSLGLSQSRCSQLRTQAIAQLRRARSREEWIESVG